MSYRDSLLAISLLCIIAGCGGSSDTAPTAAPAPAPAPAPAKVAVPVAVPTPQAAAPTPTSTAPQVIIASPDLYLLSKVIKPNFQIVEAKLNDHFRYSMPIAGGDSSSMTIVSRPPVTTPQFPARPNIQIPTGYEVVAEYGYAEDGFPQRIMYTANKSQMIYIPAGVAAIGIDDPAHEMHRITAFTDGYYIDVHEVTLEEYQLYQEDMKAQKKRYPTNPTNADQENKSMPALGIHWGQARSYLKSMGKDLPTEVEWERAARGPSGFMTPWGDGRAIWDHGRDLNDIAPVGYYRQDISPYGVKDMAGNAREWCYDFFAVDSYTQAVKGDSTPKNWVGPRAALPKNTRVVKGNGPNWNVTFRDHRVMSQGFDDVGFRGVVRMSVINVEDPLPSVIDPEGGTKNTPDKSAGSKTVPAKPGANKPTGAPKTQF
jgi:formylglycine-generating enzyme required for sulfatase activity